MAKKKSQSHDLKQTQPQTMATPTDDHSIQIQNLKNLNSVLLKETTHRRQQIESLQSALHRSAMVSDNNLALHLEKNVLFAFLHSQVKEMSLRFDTLLGDSNRREYQVADLKRLVNDLTARLRSEEHRFGVLAQERDQLNNEFLAESRRLEETVNREKRLREEAQKLILQVSENERVIGELNKDRDLAVRSSQESLTVIDRLKEEVELVKREKSEIEKLNTAQELKITALEFELKQLNESLNNSLNEEGFMRAKVLQLEGNLGLALQKEEEMATEITALLREKNEMEKSVELLTEKRDSVNKVLDMVQKELEDKLQELDEANRVRGEVEQVKVSRENEIVELRGEVDRLRGVVDELKVSHRELEEENKQLLSQVDHYRKVVDEVVLEKDNIRKGFDEERKKAENLLLKIATMQELIDKTAAEVGKMTGEKEKLFEKNMILERDLDVLMKEKNELQISIVDSQRESDELRAKVEYWCTNSNKALAMLKSTAALVCQYKDRGEEVDSNNEKLVKEIEPYAEELNAIKKAFKSKNEMVDDMKLQLVSMQKSVSEAHKSKSLWTVISSATTIFAAALAAYVARGR